MDHEWTYDDSGIWNRKYQLALEYGLVGGEAVDPRAHGLLVVVEIEREVARAAHG